MQWGYAGLFNIGVMGFVALGGLGAVLVSMPPVHEAWAAGGLRVIAGVLIGIASVVIAIMAWNRVPPGKIARLGHGCAIGKLVSHFTAAFWTRRWSQSRRSILHRPGILADLDCR